MGIKRIIGKSRAGGFALLTGCAIFLTGCQTFGTEEKVSARPDAKSPIESRSIATRGVQALREGDLELASRMFNGALKLEVQNSYLQFLNGLAYHMIAIRSDRTKFRLAEQGYRLAVKFDESNWMARYYLGLMYLDQRRTSVRRPPLPMRCCTTTAIRTFSTISRSLRITHGTLRRRRARLTRLQEVEPRSGRMLRASSIITAALGRAQEAQTWLEKYKKIEKDGQKTRQLSRRREGLGPGACACAESVVAPACINHENHAGVQLAQDQDLRNELNRKTGTGVEDRTLPQAGLAEQNKMVIVDVVIISSVEDISTAKGVNLLSGLQMQFGAGPKVRYPATRTMTTRDNLTGVTTER